MSVSSESFNLFSSLYKNITNDAAFLRVLVAKWIERPMGVRKDVGSNLVTGEEFIFLRFINFLKKRQRLKFISKKPVPKAVVIDYCADP